MPNSPIRFLTIFQLRNPRDTRAACVIYERIWNRDGFGPPTFQIAPKTRPGGHPTGDLVIFSIDAIARPSDVFEFATRCASAFGMTGQWGFTWTVPTHRRVSDRCAGASQVIDLATGRALSLYSSVELLSPASAPGDARTATG